MLMREKPQQCETVEYQATRFQRRLHGSGSWFTIHPVSGAPGDLDKMPHRYGRKLALRLFLPLLPRDWCRYCPHRHDDEVMGQHHL